MKNVLAADGPRMRRYGKTLLLTDPQVMPKAQAVPHVQRFWRVIFARTPFEQAVLLKRVN